MAVLYDSMMIVEESYSIKFLEGRKEGRKEGRGELVWFGYFWV